MILAPKKYVVPLVMGRSLVHDDKLSKMPGKQDWFGLGVW